jgi:ring-1,2-phenylacetyl-CoA epoxidase subunit PaaB
MRRSVQPELLRDPHTSSCQRRLASKLLASLAIGLDPSLRWGDGKGGSVSGEWPLWEVFVRAKAGLSHRHVGSVHAPDAQLALRHARDTYTRRQEGVSLWVVPSAEIVASDPDEAGPLFEPAADKIYRHPTFYEIPDEVKHI